MRPRHLLVPAALVVACMSLARGDDAPATSTTTRTPTFEESRRQVEELHAQVKLLNLLNGLHLDRVQLLALEGLAREAEGLRRRSQEGARADLDAHLAAMARLRETLVNGPDAVGPDVGRAVHETKEALEARRTDVDAQLDLLVARAEGLLSPAQLEIVATFKPCLLPPRDQKDPIRAGQAGGHERLIDALRALRALPDARVAAMRDRMVARWVERFERAHTTLSPAEREAEAARLATLVARVRGLSEVDFELQKEALAEEALVQDRAHELGDELAELRRARRGQDSPAADRVRDLLLSPVAARVLADKAAALDHAPAAVDPATLPEAETCEDGGCALPPTERPAERGARRR